VYMVDIIIHVPYLFIRPVVLIEVHHTHHWHASQPHITSLSRSREIHLVSIRLDMILWIKHLQK